MRDTKKILCPEHPSHQATLYLWPHELAGVWECEFGGEIYSDVCEHDPEFYELEDAVNDYYDPTDHYGHGQYEYQVYVCGVCGCTIDLDVADPLEDAFDARTDAEIDEMREREY